VRALRASSALLAALRLVFSTEASAHRREDFLQAARIGIEPDRVVIALDLTPGTAVAESFVAALDHDGDGSLSAEEQRRYAEQMVGALSVAFDGETLPVRLLSRTFPDPPAFRGGEGTIRLAVGATLPRVSAGSHELVFRNAHLAGHSAYLANALVPESADVTVTSQRRALDQAELTIAYTLRELSRRAQRDRK
jgi:hypothetical protein